MGFFSARRSEDLSEQLEQDPTVVRVIRSRFVSLAPRPALVYLSLSCFVPVW